MLADARPISTSYTGSDCVVAGVYNPTTKRTVVGIANLLRSEADPETACVVQLSVDGVKTNNISSGGFSFQSFMLSDLNLLL